MDIRILDSAYIYNFDFDTEEMRNLIRTIIIENLNEDLNLKLRDWTLYIYFRYNNVKRIMIYLKERSVPSEKAKDITIHIPFPNNQQVFWGRPLEDYIYKDPNHLDHISKNFDLLDVDFSKFENKESYVFNCMKISIAHCFSKGFRINGIELKYKDVSFLL